MSLKVSPWIRISRLYFFPLPWFIYTLGAATAWAGGWKADLSIYLVGYLFLFLVELASILANEYYDLPSDRLNRNAGPFNGGSRVLAQGHLRPASARRAFFICLVLSAGAGVALVLNLPLGQRLPVLGLFVFGILFGPGYTAPPFKLSYRGLGEIDVAILFSFYLVLCGFVFQGGPWNRSLPWLISLPLSLAVFAGISLSGIPDLDADASTGKTTLAVALGPRKVLLLAGAGAVAAFMILTGLFISDVLRGAAVIILLCPTVHGAFLLAALFRAGRKEIIPDGLDVVMWSAMSYMVWFALVPFLALMI